MKKIFLVLFFIFVLLNQFVSCSNANTGINIDKSDNGDVITNINTDEMLNTSSTEEIFFDENQILFTSQDRYDIEGDRLTVYNYNYKGDLIVSTDDAVVGFYAENGLAPALDTTTYKVGFADKNGVFVVYPIYDDATAFSKDGVAAVMKETDDNKEKWGFVNSKGEEIAPCIYDDVTSFFESGYASIGLKVGENEVYGVIDKNGNIIIEPVYDYIYWIYDDYMLCKIETSIAIVNMNGEIIEKSDDKTSFTFDEHNIYKWDIETVELESGGFSTYFDDSKIKVYNGKEFKETKIVSTLIDSKPTINGFKKGITINDENVISYKYDEICQQGSYYVCVIKGERWDDQAIDIYDENFVKTAENLEYCFEYQNFWPDGYFDVYLTEDEERLHGVIDCNGQVILKPVFYRGITYYCYENCAKLPIKYINQKYLHYFP